MTYVPQGYTLILQLGGQTHQWDGLLIPITESITVGAYAAQARRVTVELGLPDTMDPAELRRRGVELRDGWVTILYEDRHGATRTALAGPVTSAAWSRSGFEVRITVDEDAAARTTEFPPRGEITTHSSAWKTIETDRLDFTIDVRDGELFVVGASDAGKAYLAKNPVGSDEDAVAFLDDVTKGAKPRVAVRVTDDEDALGQGIHYPMPFGRPGIGPDGQRYPATPAIPYDKAGRRLIVCYQRPAATQVLLFGPSADGSDRTSHLLVPVQMRRDDEDREIGVVSFAGHEEIFDVLDDGGEEREWWDADWWCAWPDEALPGGLGDWLAMVLRLTGMQVDQRRTESVRSALNAYAIAGYIDTEVDGLAWIEDVLRAFPVSLARGGDGVYPVLLDAGAEPYMTLLEELPGEVMHFGEQVQDQARSAPNAVVIKYGHDAQEGARRYATTVTVEGSAIAAAHGAGLRTDTIDTNMVAEKATAEAAAVGLLNVLPESDQAFRFTLRRERFDDLELGDVLPVDIDDLGLTQRRLMVVGLTWDGGPYMVADTIPVARHIR